MNNNEALAYIDRLSSKYGALYCRQKDEGDHEEARLSEKYILALGVAKDAITELDTIAEIPNNSTTKNDLGVNCISRADAIQAMQDKAKKLTNEDTINGLCGAVAILFDLPSVTPQEPILNKIRDQLKSNLRGVEFTLEVLVENDPLRPKMEGAKDTLEDCLELIDKAESEV